MRNLIAILIFLLLPCLSIYAQNAQTIDLSQWNGKNTDIPFKITKVDDERENTKGIGAAYHKTKKKDISFSFASAADQMILKMIHRHFTQGNETDISLEIKKLEIAPSNIAKATGDRLYFNCAFYHTKSGALLYTFNGSNAVNPSKNPRLDITNYIARMITSAVNNFKKEYIVHPEWKNEMTATNTGVSLAVDKKITYNQFETSGDTIALKKGYKLTKNDFAAQATEGEKDDAYSYFEITYQLKSVDDGKKINLNIYPKSYFLRSKSWAKNADSVRANWLVYQQLLYDNANLHALNFKNELTTKDFTAGYYKTEINEIYNKHSRLFFDSMDLIYSETEFGQNETMVQKWLEKVNKALAEID
jgi:hypothetical protein